MKQLTKIYRLRLSDQQVRTLNKLSEYDVNVPAFIRKAIHDKISREWATIKYEKERIKLPF